jgi:hypothetical protein
MWRGGVEPAASRPDSWQHASQPIPGRANHLNIDCSMKLAQLNFLQFGFLALNKH